jgi:hypothetical protein
MVNDQKNHSIDSDTSMNLLAMTSIGGRKLQTMMNQVILIIVNHFYTSSIH